ncbi:ATP-binding cassette subfamily B protein [Breoghania corrubedonensis]|uniref:ATP-binding cassette subfamily B protein n=1 Tax=Breoghania corrubedonensis TaxID=665038 RepID=A0A2T5VGR6_9HYPH|nr:ABC transporter ATP-binding protein [Breoghania corrubedonensis]PTW62928.1 ATP-binding cassette subfamily B protein [Breoghania corrubedonensis]
MPLLRLLAQWLFKDPESSLSLIRRLLAENARRYVWQYAVAFALMGLVAATTAGSAWIMRDIINEIFIEKREGMIFVIAGVVVGLYFLKGAATYGQNVIMTRIGNNIVAINQRRLFDHILGQGMNFFDRHVLGDLSTRMSHNASAARSVIDLIVVSLGRDLLSLVGLLFVVIYMDPGMATLALLVGGPAVLGVNALIKKTRKVAKAQFVSMTQIVSTMQESVLGARVVKAFTAEDSMRGRMRKAIDDVERQSNRMGLLRARTSPMMETLGGISVGLVIIWGGFSVIHRGSDPGAFFAFLTALLMAYEPAKRLARMQVQLENGMVGVKIMYDLLDMDLTIDEKDGAQPLSVPHGEVRFDDVHFGYAHDQKALNGLDFVAEAGKTTALVGASGAGKSTVLALIERFYDVSAGRVLIDDQDIRDVTVASLRGSIALVTQDTFLFEGSVHENILRGRPGATHEEVRQAARDANAEEFIVELASGYDEPVGENGGRLSGGQRQRIAIARAMLRDAPILLLDEATSALDAESESKIQVALERLMQDRTTIVIAHRLSTVRNADKIVVMDHGRAAEEGSHADLMQKDALYRKLHDLQFKV